MSKIRQAVAATVNAAKVVISAVFSDTTRATAKEAFAADKKSKAQWKALGIAVRSDVKSAAALDKIRPQVLRELVYQNMPDVLVNGATYSALAVVDYAIPRKGTESYNKATAAEKELWAAMQAASATVRGEGSVFYGRIKKYGYSEEYVNPEKAKKAKAKAKAKAKKAKPSAKVLQALATLTAMIQKMESPDFAVKPVVDALEAAQRAVAAGLPKSK